jgi:glycosyltransferase involved in cell wall biosynthesis
MSVPELSVIMSVYNSEKYLKEAIESILNQTFANFEFIIVNDASTDNSHKIIQGYDDDRIVLVNNKENLGLTKSLNNALDIAKGNYVARQDSDDISVDSRLEKQFKYFIDNPDVILLGSNIIKIDYNRNVLGPELKIETPKFSDLLIKNQFNHGSVMFLKDVVLDLGGYDELFRYVQDYDLWLRIAKKYQVKNLNEILYELRIHEETIGFNKIEESELYRLLAVKIATNNLTQVQIEDIKKNGISSIYNYLTKKEKINTQKIINKRLGDLYSFQGNLKVAREYYKKNYNIDKFDPFNNFRLLRCYFGKNVTQSSAKLYNQINDFKTNIKNLLN